MDIVGWRMGQLRNVEARGERNVGEGGHADILCDVGVFVFCKCHRMECQDILEQAAQEGKDTVNTLYYMEQRNGGQTQVIQPQHFH